MPDDSGPVLPEAAVEAAAKALHERMAIHKWPLLRSRLAAEEALTAAAPFLRGGEEELRAENERLRKELRTFQRRAIGLQRIASELQEHACLNEHLANDALDQKESAR